MSVPNPAAIHLPRTLTQLLEEAVASSGDAPFLGIRTSSARELSMTMSEFGRAVSNAAARLAAAVEPRARILVQGAPSPGFAAALFAAGRANVVLVPLDVRMTADTIDRIAALTQPSAILLGSGSTVEPVTIPRLAALPEIDLDDLADVYDAGSGRIAVAYRAGAAFGDPVEDEDEVVARAVKAANGKLAAHQRIAEHAPFPETDFPRTHTRKVQRSDVAARMLRGRAAA